MHQIEVNVIGLEVFEGGIQSLFDVFGIMFVIPKFGGEEDLVARNARLLDRISL